MNHFSIAYMDNKNDSFEICEYAENADEAINYAMKDIPLLKDHKEYIYRCTNESALDWLQKSSITKDVFKKKDHLTKDKGSSYNFSFLLNKIFNYKK